MYSVSARIRSWRVFYTKPRAEKQAEIRLTNAGFEVFCPKRSTIRQWSDRRKTIEAPLFPGYLFAHVDERQRLEALNDPALVRCVAFGGELATAAEDEIESLRLLQKTTARIDSIDRMAYPVGSDVYIDKGPLNGLRGCIVDHPKSQYLIVDVPSIRQSVRVHLPVDWVRRPAGFELSA